MDHGAIEFANRTRANGSPITFTLHHGLLAITVGDQDIHPTVFTVLRVDHGITLARKEPLRDILFKGKGIHNLDLTQRQRPPFAAMAKATEPTRANVAPREHKRHPNDDQAECQDQVKPQPDTHPMQQKPIAQPTIEPGPDQGRDQDKIGAHLEQTAKVRQAKLIA